MAIKSINPTTGETLKVFDELTDQQIDEKIRLAAEAFEHYRKTTFKERAGCLSRAAEILESEKEQFGRLMTAEMGKPLKAGIDEAAKCAWACRYYVENGERFLADQMVETNASRSFIHYQPLGPILAVMPWNFPFWQVFRFAAPALMAGNVGLLKHASNVPQCALAIEDIFRRAGFAPGVFQTLLIGSKAVSAVIADPRIKAVTLTGSTPAGSSVAGQAGKYLKKTVLELGGSDPFIVMPSANFDEAVRTAVQARVINNGQSCIAAKRFIVHEQIADAFEQRMVEGMRALRVGNPMDPSTQVGPLATRDILETLDEQVRKSVEMGARVLTGGKILDRPGNFYEPTVITNIPKDSPAYQEELFGPVASLFRVPDIDSAIQLANDSIYGLGASAWTNDEHERSRFINEIEAGLVFINGMVASDPRLPFGGVKQSGYGRELSEAGIREFVNIKTVWVNDGTEQRHSTTE
ncbi:MAG: NAD-dependent succinate-semialdehyde dehydrogenase [Chloroflexi bacterium]|nr:NAD-dependent succinate-semialdehyde dehydrogenase [Chloroflexota bacterium]